MGDPLSVTASVFAIVGAIKKSHEITQMLQSLRHINDDSRDLSDELSALEDVLASVEAIVQSVPQASPALATVSRLLFRLEVICHQTIEPLEELQRLSEIKLANRKEKRELQASKLGWLWHRKDVVRLRDRIRIFKESLSLLLIAFVASQNAVEMSRRRIEGSPVSDVEQPCLVEEKGICCQSESDTCVHNIIDIDHLKHVSLEHRNLDDRTTFVQYTRSSSPSCTMNDKQSLQSAPQAISRKQNGCERFCPCRCHVFTYFQTPQWLKCLIGSLFWHSNSTTMLTRKNCDRFVCSRSGPVTLRICYFTPQWASMRALSFRVTNVVPSGLDATIRLMRIVPRDAAVWPLLQNGETQKLQLLFQKREFSPFDMLDDGTSLLHYAGMCGRFDTCSFLVLNGADRYFCDSRGKPAIQPGLDLFLKSGNMNRSSVNIFSNEAFAEEQGFTVLHKIILGCCPLDLATQLQYKAVQDLDSRDSNGRTPLLWAAWNGRADYVQILIENGAALDAVDLEKESALSKACQAGQYECAKFLLNAGALPNLGNCYNIQPIHFACQTKYPIAIRLINILLHCGVDVNTVTDSHATPLHFAASFGAAETIDHLLQHHADIAARNNSGFNTSFMALANWHNDLFCHLVNCGADLRPSFRSGLNILHLAAWAASYHSWTVIEEAARKGRLRGVDVDARHDSHTVSDCLERCRPLRSGGGKDMVHSDIADIRQVLAGLELLVKKPDAYRP